MEKVDIDQDLLATFRNEKHENGAGQSVESQDSQRFSQSASNALRGIDKSLGKLCDFYDRRAKDLGGSGIGSEPDKKDYRELLMINIEEWAAEMKDQEFLKKSPRYMLGLVTATIVLPDIYDIYQQQKKDKQIAASSAADPEPKQQQESKTEDY